MHVGIISEADKTLIEAGGLKYDEVTLENCHEQSFILQALVDSGISPERWSDLTPALEAMNTFIGGFTMDQRDELHPDIGMGHVDKSSIVKAVKQFILAAKKQYRAAAA